MFMRRERSHSLISSALVALVLLVPQSWGQQVTAAIVGAVSDPSGAALPSATLTARDVDRGTTWKVQTNAEGVYNFPHLSIGKYDVRVEAQGFQTAVHAPFS